MVVTNVQVVPRERNQKRLDRVKAFWQMPGVDSCLRTTSLSLQITDHVHNLAAKLTADGASQPAPVRIAQCDVHKLVHEELNKLLPKLHMNAHLNITATFTVLLATSVETLIRFDEYLE